MPMCEETESSVFCTYQLWLGAHVSAFRNAGLRFTPAGWDPHLLQ
jgi:hypothetical protein